MKNFIFCTVNGHATISLQTQNLLGKHLNPLSLGSNKVREYSIAKKSVNWWSTFCNVAWNLLIQFTVKFENEGFGKCDLKSILQNWAKVASYGEVKLICCYCHR